MKRNKVQGFDWISFVHSIAVLRILSEKNRYTANYKTYYRHKRFEKIINVYFQNNILINCIREKLNF